MGHPPSSPTLEAFRRRFERRASLPPVKRWSQGIAGLITRFCGSMVFVVLHIVWFAAWIAYNIAAAKGFDPFPFGLLTLIVSLEAIFLNTFVLISQNRESAQSDQQMQQDFQTDVYVEALSELIAAKVGVDFDAVRTRYEERIAEARTESGRTDAPGT